MPDTGAPHYLPYPVLSNPGHGPEALLLLATKTAERLSAVSGTTANRWLWTGEITFPNSTVATLLTITWPATWPTKPRVVHATITGSRGMHVQQAGVDEAKRQAVFAAWVVDGKGAYNGKRELRAEFVWGV